MRIKATAPRKEKGGPFLDVRDFCGRLELAAQTAQEQRMLAGLYAILTNEDESSGEFYNRLFEMLLTKE